MTEGNWMGVGRLFERVAEGGREGLERLRDQRVRIGVTGFSGSGKSTFVASLVNQLLMHSENSLPALPPSLHERIVGVRIDDQPLPGLARFPYESAMDRLSASPPRWPEPTRDLSGLLLEIRYRPRRRLLPVPGRGLRSLFVEIRDYPGEWLLDLPLLRQGFAEWCRDRAGDYARTPRRELLGPLRERLLALDPLAAYSARTHELLAAEHAAFLGRCRAHRLSLNQPGRALLPGSDDDASASRLLPLLQVDALAQAASAAARGSWYAQLERAYDDYVKRIVKPFFRSYFAAVDRQVVLIDLLSSLSFGPESFADMTAAMSRVLDTYRFGSSSLVRRLFDPHIDRVLYVATKMDHVHPAEHDRLRQLLWRLLKRAIRDVGFDRTDVHNAVIAAVRCTMPSTDEGRPGLVATTLDGRRGIMSHPRMPERPPNADDWQALADWRMPQLQPPAGLDCRRREAIPHMRMDSVIRELIGDKFQ